MIKNHKIIIATTLSNAITTGYFPTSYAALKTYSKYDFIDEVLIAEGLSEDKTIEKHKLISSKINFLSKKKWPVNKWNWQNLYDQYDAIYKYCRDLKEDCIMLYLSSDQLLTPDFASELKIALENLVENKDLDFFLLPFTKTINYEYRTRVYDKMPHFHLHSALKFGKERQWQCVRGPQGIESTRGENTLIGDREGLKMNIDFKNFPICYDMFMFTRENLNHKIKRYGRSFDGPARIYGEGTAWPEKYQDYLSQIWLKKVISLNPVKLKFNDHPIEMRRIMTEYLDESRFGLSCFNLLGQQIGLGIIK